MAERVAMAIFDNPAACNKWMCSYEKLNQHVRADMLKRAYKFIEAMEA